MNALAEWLVEADRALSASDCPEEVVDELLAAGLSIDMQAAVAAGAHTSLDANALSRVITAFEAQCAAVSEELADLARRRADFVRKQYGIAGYTAVSELVL